MGSSSFFVALAALLVGIPFAVHQLVTPTYGVHQPGSAAVLITGASSGIGLHAALALEDMGYVVYAGVRKQKDAEALQARGRPLLRPILLDVSKSDDCRRAAAEIQAALSADKMSLLGLVNNAGISHRIPLELENVKRAREMFDVNYWGAIEMLQQFLPLLREATPAGRIVNIGSVAALIPVAGSGTYSAVKAALEAATDSLRLEVAPWNISVSMVEPAYVKSSIVQKQVGSNSPLVGVPQEKASLYKDWTAAFEKKRLKFDELASEQDVTTEAIIDALTSPKPKTRYIVAKVGHVPAWVYVRLSRWLPDRVRDFLVLKVA